MAKLFNQEKMVTIGDKFCVCELCKKEITAKNVDELDEKMKELEGILEGKPIFKLYRRGEFICICKKHIEKILNDIKDIENKMNLEKREDNE